MGGVKVAASVAVGAGVGVNAMDPIADVLTEAAMAESSSAAENDAARDDAEVSVAVLSVGKATATTTEDTAAVPTTAEPSVAKEATSAAAHDVHATCNGVATPDSSAAVAAQDENDRVRKRKAKTAPPCHVANGKRVVSNGNRPTAEENGGTQDQSGDPPRSTPSSVEVIDLEAEVDTESDSVAVAPVLVASAVDPGPNDDSKKRSRSPDAAKDDDDELAGVTSVEDPHSPEVICLDSDDKDDTQEEEEGGASEVGVAKDAPGRPYHRRKKRGRAFGFSNNRSRKENKLKRQSLAIVANDAAADAGSHVVPAPSKGRGRPRRQQSGDAVHGDPNVSTVQPATSSSDAVAWNWESCRDYFDPLTQSNMNELASVRRDSARVVAANSHAWGSIRRLEHDDAYLARLATDAGDGVDHLRIRTTRRGRSFRDAWEEEDFVTNQLRASRTGKKRPFAGCETITSNRELVHGYDDELFSAYTKLLEDRVGCQESPKHLQDTNGVTEQPQRIEAPPKRRLKTAKRRSVETYKSTLPAVPAHHLHPASFGAWKLKGKDSPSFDVLHPASIRSTKTPQRWVEEFVREEVQTTDASRSGPRRSGRHEAKAHDDSAVGDQEDEDEGEAEVQFGDDESTHDEAIQLPSFGVVLEEDEISREITNSLMRLVEVSALNWRRTQTLYERAVSYVEVTPLLHAEEAASQRLEHLYRTLYPPSANPDEEVDDYEREFKLWRRPKDLLSFVSRSSSGVTDSLAIRGALEYAWRLKIGDSIDVLDRNGCWNDGVVIDIYADAGGEIKNVLVSFALWGADSTEWVPVVEARILPRGVADGRVLFTLGPNRTRKRYVELNKEVADFLQRSYPSRQKAQLVLSGIDNDPESDSTTKPSGTKKQRRK